MHKHWCTRSSLINILLKVFLGAQHVVHAHINNAIYNNNKIKGVIIRTLIINYYCRNVVVVCFVYMFCCGNNLLTLTHYTYVYCM